MLKADSLDEQIKISSMHNLDVITSHLHTTLWSALMFIHLISRCHQIV